MIVKIEQPNCVPCQILGNLLTDLDVAPDATFNVADNPEVAMKLGIMGAPFLFHFDKELDLVEADEEVIQASIVTSVKGINEEQIKELLTQAGKL